MREFGQQRGGQFPGPLRQVGVGHQEQTHGISLEGGDRPALMRTNRHAVGVRSRIVELGGAAAINLSASVTDVVLLDGANGTAG
ncbi:hypothetical protein GCM10027072_65670 [Streptomyces bullii]